MIGLEKIAILDTISNSMNSLLERTNSVKDVNKNLLDNPIETSSKNAEISKTSIDDKVSDSNISESSLNMPIDISPEDTEEKHIELAQDKKGVLPSEELNKPIEGEDINVDSISNSEEGQTYKDASLDDGEMNGKSDFPQQNIDGLDVEQEKLVETDIPKSYGEFSKDRDCGGSYKDLKMEGWGWNDNPPHEVHHMPADSISHIEREDGPAIAMDYEDHQKTASCGSSREAKEYRAKQKELVDKGDFHGAFQMDVDDLHDKFGNKYDDAIEQARKYVEQLVKDNKI